MSDYQVTGTKPSTCHAEFGIHAQIFKRILVGALYLESVEQVGETWFLFMLKAAMNLIFSSLHIFE